MHGYSARHIRPASQWEMKKRVREFTAALIVSTAVMLAPGEMFARGVENMAEVAQKYLPTTIEKEGRYEKLHRETTNALLYFTNPVAHKDAETATKIFRGVLQRIESIALDRSFIEDIRKVKGFETFEGRTFSDLRKYMEKNDIDEPEIVNAAYKMAVSQWVAGMKMDRDKKDYLIRMIDEHLNMAGYFENEKFSLFDDEGLLENAKNIGENWVCDRDTKVQAAKNAVILLYLERINLATELTERPENTGAPPRIRIQGDDSVSDLMKWLDEIYQNTFPPAFEKNLPSAEEKAEAYESEREPSKSLPNLKQLGDIAVGGETQTLLEDKGVNIRNKNGKSYANAKDVATALGDPKTWQGIAQHLNKSETDVMKEFFENPDSIITQLEEGTYKNQVISFKEALEELKKRGVVPRTGPSGEVRFEITVNRGKGYTLEITGGYKYEDYNTHTVFVGSRAIFVRKNVFGRVELNQTLTLLPSGQQEYATQFGGGVGSQFNFGKLTFLDMTGSLQYDKGGITAWQVEVGPRSELYFGEGHTLTVYAGYILSSINYEKWFGLPLKEDYAHGVSANIEYGWYPFENELLKFFVGAAGEKNRGYLLSPYFGVAIDLPYIVVRMRGSWEMYTPTLGGY